MDDYLRRKLGPRLLKLTDPETLTAVYVNIFAINGCHISKDGKHTVLTFGGSDDTPVLESTEDILNRMFYILSHFEPMSPWKDY